MELTVNRLGGALWINLANTVRMQDKRRTDRLLDQRDLQEWLRDNQLPESVQALPFELAQRELVRLRDLCDTVLENLERHGHLLESTYRTISAQAETLQLGLKLTRNGQEGLNLEYEGRSGEDALRFLVIRSIADTLRSVPPERIRKCEHADCILHFADTSKSGRRRWCRMESCGNRHKAAEFYAKKKQRAEH